MRESDRHTDDRTVVILDNGLIKFTKFALAILAIFVVFGTYVFGFDIKKLVDEMHDLRTEISGERTNLDTARKELEKSQAELQVTLAKLQETQQQIDIAHKKALNSARSAEGHVIKIEAYLSQAGLLIARIEEFSQQALSADEQLVAATARDDLLTKSGVPIERPAKLWPIGQELRVRFTDGTPEQHESVEAFAREWETFANITFVFGSTDDDAEVRVGFDKANGSWGYLGTDALGIPTSQVTMNLAWVTRSNVIHEFGHVLGLVHEHQNPIEGLTWDTDKITAALSGPPNYWSAAQVDLEVARKIEKKDYPGERAYDPYSVMGYSFPVDWVIQGTPPQPSDGLSESDQVYVASLYPK